MTTTASKAGQWANICIALVALNDLLMNNTSCDALPQWNHGFSTLKL